MKTYTADRQLRLVGKAWEVREYLKMTLGRVPADVSLASFLEGSLIPLHDKLSSPALLGIAGTLPKRHSTRLQKMPDRLATPFPSK